METDITGSWKPLMDGLLSFLAAADIHTVISIVLLTYLAQTTLWRHLKLWPEAIVWVPLLLSFVLTPVMSSSAEATWGGKWYWRAVIYNGGVGIFVWRVALPQLQKRWPTLFAEEPKPEGGTS
jgi:hypothetical protein